MEMTNPKTYTVEEFEAIADAPENADRLLELINGEVYEKMPTELHGLCVMNIGTELNLYARRTKSGRVGTEVRHRKRGDKLNARLPDVSYSLKRPDEPIVKKGSVLRMPDVAVEIQSPDDDLDDLRAKLRYYLENGTQLGLLVIPDGQTVEVHLPDGSVTTLDETETIDGGSVLPGFTMTVKDIFYDPSEEDEA